MNGAIAPWDVRTRWNDAGVHKGHDEGFDTSPRRRQRKVAGVWCANNKGKPTQSLAESEEFDERADLVGGAGAGGSGGPETPGRTSDFEGGPGFTSIDETVARFPRLFYNQAKFDEKNWRLLFMPFFFVVLSIRVVDLLVLQVRPRC